MANPFYTPHANQNPKMDLKQLYQMLTQSNNPAQLFYNIAKNNPNMKPALYLLQNGYSDYYGAVANDTTTYGKLAKKFIMDKDAKQGKAFHYYMAMKN